MELYGNIIWNNSVSNSEKTVIITNEKNLRNIIDTFEKGGLNFCAYIYNKAAHIAINISDCELVKQMPIEYEAMLSPNKENEPTFVIGNTAYKNIQERHYRKFDTDLALKIAQRLDEAKIPYSGKINDDSTTLTINKSNAENLKNIADEIKLQRKSLNTDGETINENKEQMNTEQLLADFSDEQIKAINSAYELLLEDSSDEQLFSAFESTFKGKSNYTANQLTVLAAEFTSTFKGKHGFDCWFADRTAINELIKNTDAEIFISEVTKGKGFNSKQIECIKELRRKALG